MRTGGQLKLRDGRQPVWGHTVGGTRGCPPPMLQRHSTSTGGQGSHRCGGCKLEAQGARLGTPTGAGAEGAPWAWQGTACSVQRGIGAAGSDDVKMDITQTRGKPETGHLKTILELSLLVTWWMILNWVEPSRTPLQGRVHPRNILCMHPLTWTPQPSPLGALQREAGAWRGRDTGPGDTGPGRRGAEPARPPPSERKACQAPPSVHPGQVSCPFWACRWFLPTPERSRGSGWRQVLAVDRDGGLSQTDITPQDPHQRLLNVN